MPIVRLSDWEVIARSVRGPTHVRSGLPNQDHFGRHTSAGAIVVAVSDGHGSARSFRSDRGSKYATEAAIEVTQKFFLGEWERLSLQERQQQLEIRLPTRIVGEWREKVRRDLEEFPLSEQEYEPLASHQSVRSRSNREDVPYIVYGATLLTVVITTEFVVHLQLGDGDILTVLESGDVIRPLSIDERLIGNETTSLSSGTAANDFRLCIKPSAPVLPSLILMATDGYSNSFKDDASFFKAGLDFRHLLDSTDGYADVEQHLTEWLEESAQMSGDDVTLCLLYRQLNATDVMASTDRRVPGSVDPQCLPDTERLSAPEAYGSNNIPDKFISGNRISPDGEPK